MYPEESTSKKRKKIPRWEPERIYAPTPTYQPFKKEEHSDKKEKNILIIDIADYSSIRL